MLRVEKEIDGRKLDPGYMLSIVQAAFTHFTV